MKIVYSEYMAYRVLITGSRGWKYVDVVRRELRRVVEDTGLMPEEVIVVHGGAAGADNLAGLVAEELGMRVEVHKADWAAFGKTAGFLRNAEMVNLGAERVLAFWDGNSRGTSHTINLALNAGLDLRVFKSP
jgi:hypothetical protein